MMGLSVRFDSTNHYSRNETTLVSTIQNCSLSGRCVVDYGPLLKANSMIDYSVPGNRLCERHGYIEIVPKTPAEVLGEWMLRPLLNVTYNWSIYSLEVLQSGLYRLEGVFSRTLNFLPGAEARSTILPNPKKASEQELLEKLLQQSTEVATDDVSHSAVKSAFTGRKKKESSYFRPVAEFTQKEHQHLSSKKSDSSSTNTDLETIRKGLGSDVFGQFPDIFIDPSLISRCMHDDAIRCIIDFKKPNPSQRLKIKEAYNDLQNAANTDSLAECHRQVMELLDKMEANGDSYFVDILRSLPELLTSLLDNSGRDYTRSDLEDLVKKINQLSIKMLTRLQGTNEGIAFSNWIDVMLKSTEKNTRLVSPTMETAIRILQGNKGNIVSREQEKHLRAIITSFKIGFISEEEKAIVDKVMEITGPQSMFLRFVASYLETIPGDIRKCDQHITDIALEIYRSTALRSLVLLVTGRVVLWSMPENTKKILFISCWILFLGQILYDFAAHPLDKNSGVHT